MLVSRGYQRANGQATSLAGREVVLVEKMNQGGLGREISLVVETERFQSGPVPYSSL